MVFEKFNTANITKCKLCTAILLAASISAFNSIHSAAQSKPAAPQPAPKAVATAAPIEAKSGEDLVIGALRVSVWRPSGAGAHPLVIFSHGFHGSSRQSTVLMKTLAEHGYLVIAPNHKDAMSFGKAGVGLRPPAESFVHASRWSEATYKDRATDIRVLVKNLKSDAAWNKQIDWSKVALMGHSLGGYTALGLAGAWGSWYLPETKAVIALSPFCTPFIAAKTLNRISVPVMYQGGTKDFGITPTVRLKGGAFDQTPAPEVFVDFSGANHFAWTDLNPTFQQEIGDYCVAFLDKYLKGDQSADPLKKTASVAMIRSK